MKIPRSGKYLQVNGADIYYEIHGSGQPIVLLHGGLGSIGMFEPLLPRLSEHHQVIAIELQAHARTPDIGRPLSYELMADDIAGVIAHLAVGASDFLGYSLGAGVALQTAIRHPEVVRKLVIVSAPCKSEGWYPEVREGMKAMNADTAKMLTGSHPHRQYKSMAPHPENWSTLVVKIGELLGGDYDWSEDISAMKAPSMIVVGDADAVRLDHAVHFFKLLNFWEFQSGLCAAMSRGIGIFPLILRGSFFSGLQTGTTSEKTATVLDYIGMSCRKKRAMSRTKKPNRFSHRRVGD